MTVAPSHVRLEKSTSAVELTLILDDLRQSVAIPIATRMRDHMDDDWVEKCHNQLHIDRCRYSPDDLYFLLLVLKSKWTKLRTVSDAPWPGIEEMINLRHRWAHWQPISEADLEAAREISHLVKTGLGIPDTGGAGPAKRHPSFQWPTRISAHPLEFVRVPEDVASYHDAEGRRRSDALWNSTFPDDCLPGQTYTEAELAEMEATRKAWDAAHAAIEEWDWTPLHTESHLVAFGPAELDVVTIVVTLLSAVLGKDPPFERADAISGFQLLSDGALQHIGISITEEVASYIKVDDFSLSVGEQDLQDAITRSADPAVATIEVPVNVTDAPRLHPHRAQSSNLVAGRHRPDGNLWYLAKDLDSGFVDSFPYQSVALALTADSPLDTIVTQFVRECVIGREDDHLSRITKARNNLRLDRTIRGLRDLISPDWRDNADVDDYIWDEVPAELAIDSAHYSANELWKAVMPGVSIQPPQTGAILAQTEILQYPRHIWEVNVIGNPDDTYIKPAPSGPDDEVETDGFNSSYGDEEPF